MSEDRRAFFRGIMRSAAEVAGAPPPPVDAPVLDEPDIERYSRQLVLPEWSEAAQRALGEASVLVVGAGALGSPVAAYLAGAGVGRLGIVDSDDVELSNLHRQPLHFTPDLGTAKAQSAAAKLRYLNPDVLVEPYQARFNPAHARGRRPRRRLQRLVRHPLRGQRRVLRRGRRRSSRAACSGSPGS